MTPQDRGSNANITGRKRYSPREWSGWNEVLPAPLRQLPPSASPPLRAALPSAHIGRHAAIAVPGRCRLSAVNDFSETAGGNYPPSRWESYVSVCLWQTEGLGSPRGSSGGLLYTFVLREPLLLWAGGFA